MLVLMITTLFCTRANAVEPISPSMIQQVSYLHLQVRYVDPTISNPPLPRNPIQIPEIDLDDYTLTFYTSCLGSTLRLVNAEDEVVYTTVITSDTLVLPSSLEGEYELQIVQGEWCFYGWIEL